MFQRLSGGDGPAYGALALVLLLITLTRLPWCVQRIFNCDEGGTAVIAAAILDGKLPYRGIFEHRGPVLDYVFALLFLIFQKYNFAALHKALLLLHLGIAGLLFKSGTLLGKKWAGVLTALTFAISSLLQHGSDAAAFHTIHLAIFFTALAGFFCIRAVLCGSLRGWFAAGLCFGMAFLSKQPAGLDLLPALLLAGASGYEHQKRRGLVLSAASLVLGFAAVFAAVCLFFLMQGAFQEFWFNFWTFNFRFYIPAQPLAERFRVAVSYLMGFPLGHSNVLYKNTIAMFCAAIFLLRGLLFIPRIGSGPERRRLFLDGYLIGWFFSAFAGATLSGRAYGHYFLQCLPPLCLMTGMMLAEGGHSLLQVWQRRPRMRGVAAGVMILAAGYLALSGVSFFTMLRKVERQGFPNAVESRVIHAIWRESGSQDTLFIWGFYPEFYSFSGRRPGSRFFIPAAVTGAVLPKWLARQRASSPTAVPGAQEQMMQDLERSRPLLFLETSQGNLRGERDYSMDHYPALAAFVNENYDLIEVFPKQAAAPYFYLYKRKPELHERH